MSREYTNYNVIIVDHRNNVFHTHQTFKEKIWHLLHFGMSFLGENEKDRQIIISSHICYQIRGQMLLLAFKIFLRKI